MSNPLQIAVAAFPDQASASEALKLLRDAQREGTILILDAAVITKDDKGKVKIKETADMKAGKGAVIGAVTGGVLSLLAGPLGLMALGGGLLGGLAAKMRDGGFSDARLKRIAESLTPNSSAIIAVVEHTWVEQLDNLLAEVATDVVTEELASDIASQLQENKAVTYTVVDTGEDIVAGEATLEPESTPE